jgi:hypothetical protein
VLGMTPAGLMIVTVRVLIAKIVGVLSYFYTSNPGAELTLP